MDETIGNRLESLIHAYFERKGRSQEEAKECVQFIRSLHTHQRDEFILSHLVQQESICFMQLFWLDKVKEFVSMKDLGYSPHCSSAH